VAFAASVYHLSTRFWWREALAVLLKADFVKLAILIALSHFAYIVVRAWRWRVAVRDAISGAALLDCYWITAFAVRLSVPTPRQPRKALKIPQGRLVLREDDSELDHLKPSGIWAQPDEFMDSHVFDDSHVVSHTFARILRPGLGLVLPGNSSFPSALRRSFDKLEQQINSWVDKAKLAA
jgi:hypothetical protein